MTQTFNDNPVGALALVFAQAVVTGDFAAAHALLSAELQAALQPTDLARDYQAMMAYTDSAPTEVKLIQVEDMNGWKVKQAGDLGWAYVAIEGEGYSEAVSVIVAQEAGAAVIRWLEWGRP